MEMHLFLLYIMYLTIHLFLEKFNSFSHLFRYHYWKLSLLKLFNVYLHTRLDDKKFIFKTHC